MTAPTAGGRTLISQADAFDSRLTNIETAGDAGQSASNATTGNTTSTSYTSTISAGSCPSVTVTLAAGQNCMVIVTAELSSSATTAASSFSFAVSGAATEAATDARSARSTLATGATFSRPTLYTAVSAGSYTFQSQIRSSAAGTATSAQRNIIAQPLAYP